MQAADTKAPVRVDPLPLEFPGAHFMDQDEIEAVVRVLRSHSLFRYYGPDLQYEVKQFEQEMAAFLGVKHALGVASGTGALHVTMGALGIGPGDEVIVPAYGWVSILAAVVHRGALPVIADIDDTFCLDPAEVERKITPRTKGVVLAHMSGAPGRAPALRELTSKRGLFLVEDCAQCAGGSIGGKKVGTFGDMAIFSFQLNKNMTSGEGGCVVTNETALWRRAVACHDLGYARDENGRMMLDDIALWGMGYRMDELRAAVLRVQLRKLPAITAAMRRSKHRVRAALEGRVQLRSIPDLEGDTGCFLITTYPDRAEAERVQQGLRGQGIRTGAQGVSNIVMTNWGLHLYYNNRSLTRRASVDGRGFPWSLPANEEARHSYERGACPNADSLFERSILIPIPSCLNERDEDDVIAAFDRVL
jgi:8-amino-3,8-dideoxy-alpha-D-manno-octulosonate transaminase